MTSFPKMDAVQVQSKYIDGSGKARRTLVDGEGRELAVIQSKKYHGVSPDELAREIAFRLRLGAKLQADHDALREVNAELLAALDRVSEMLFDDAVNGHALNKQVVTREQLGEIYEIARVAIAKAKGVA